MNWFNNLKIKQKLLLSFSIIIIITATISIIGVSNISTISRLSDQSYQLGTLGVVYISKMNDALQKLRNEVRNTLLVESSNDLNKSLDDIDRYIHEFESISKLYETTYANEDDKNMHQSVKEHFSNYIGTLGGFKTLLLASKKAEATKYMYDIIVPQNNEIIKTMPRIVELNNKTVKEYDDIIKDKSTASEILMTTIAIAGIILSIFLGLFISSIINKPLHKLEEAAVKLSQGNLNIEVDIQTKDEIGNLANSFKTMMKNFRDLIQKVLNQSEKINKESEELFSISNVAASASAELQAQSSTASSSSEQVSANVSTVATSTEEMTASIKEISKNTTSASILTKESEQRANEANTVMTKLGESSHEIGNIVKSITSIAEQTNLLALNATIEAARAGELGKGFAVVANEVKELAKESAKATEDITNKIKAIQIDTSNAVNVIQGIIQNIAQVNEVTNTIASAIEEQSVTTNEVNRNLNEATQGVQSIVEVVVGISSAANDYSKQAVMLKNSSTSLKTMANELEKEIKANFRF
jgi:methyl-accepting chemotaxis protein